MTPLSALVGAGVGEVPAHVGQARSEAVEDRAVELFAGAFDAFGRVLAQLLDRPVVAGDADDRAVQEPALLEPVEREERHHLGQIAGDAEDHEHVCCLRLAGPLPLNPLAR